MQPSSGLDGRGRTAMTAGPRPHRRPRGHPERPGLAGFAPSLRNGRGSTPLASARVPCRPCFAPTAAVRRRRGLTTPAVHCTKQATQTLLLTAKGERLTPPTRDDRFGRISIAPTEARQPPPSPWRSGRLACRSPDECSSSISIAPGQPLGTLARLPKAAVTVRGRYSLHARGVRDPRSGGACARCF